MNLEHLTRLETLSLEVRLMTNKARVRTGSPDSQAEDRVATIVKVKSKGSVNGSTQRRTF